MTHLDRKTVAILFNKQNSAYDSRFQLRFDGISRKKK